VRTRAHNFDFELLASFLTCDIADLCSWQNTKILLFYSYSPGDSTLQPDSADSCEIQPIGLGMGVDHGGGQGGQVPHNFERGTLIHIVPPRFCHIGTKMSVLWPSKYAKIRFRPGLRPVPRWGSSRPSPDPLVGWRGDTPPHIPSHSTRTHLRHSPCVPPEVQPDLRLCVYVVRQTGRRKVTWMRSSQHKNDLAVPTK